MLTEPCLFTFKNGGELNLAIVIYVDDLIIASKTEQGMKMFKDQISARFRMEDMGRLHHYLGIRLSETSILGKHSLINLCTRRNAWNDSACQTPNLLERQN